MCLLFVHCLSVILFNKKFEFEFEFEALDSELTLAKSQLFAFFK